MGQRRDGLERRWGVREEKLHAETCVEQIESQYSRHEVHRCISRTKRGDTASQINEHLYG